MNQMNIHFIFFHDDSRAYNSTYRKPKQGVWVDISDQMISMASP